MPASYAKGMLFGYSGWMTSHWNGKDRWSRHYGCSQTLFHLPFLEQNTSGLMSDSFWKVNLGKMRWVHWTDTTIQFLYSYLQGFYFCSFFFYWLFTVCKLPVLDNKILSNSDNQRMGCVCDNHLSLMGSLVSWLHIFERWKMKELWHVWKLLLTRLHLKNVQMKCRLIAAYHTETYLKHIMINIKCIIKSSMWLTGS